MLIVAAAMLAGQSLGAQAGWLTLRTQHHQVAGNVSTRELKDVALRLEQFRDIVETLNDPAARVRQDESVVALVFRDDRSFRPFTPLVDDRRLPVAGMFLSGLGGAFITLNLDSGEAAYPAIYHEYSHFLLRGVFGGAPLWFSEGLAEYYSTLEVTSDGRRAIIGTPIPHHVQLLRQRRLPLARLLDVKAASEVYNRDTPERALLYAQSWAMVHHAFHAQPRRREALVNLALKLAAGARPEQAVVETYGMALADLEQQLLTYMRRELYQATSVEFRDAIVTSIAADVKPADAVEVDIWMGAVQSRIGRPDEAEVRLERALKARPDSGGAHAALAMLRLAQGRSADAKQHLDAARKAGALPAPQVVEVTGRDAARLFFNAGNYSAVRSVLTPIVREDRSDIGAALMLADALLHLDDADGARALLGPVLASPVATEDEKAQTRVLLARSAEVRARLGNPPAPTAPPTPSLTKDVRQAPRLTLDLRVVRDGEQRTFGTLQSVECGRTSVSIVLTTDKGTTRASAGALSAIDFVTFRSSAGGSVSCGPQTPVPALLTWRRDGTQTIAVALELLPDGYVPE
jgi:tetratricopeptide (TPR) repeat protein